MSRVQCKIEECDVEDHHPDTGQSQEIPGVCVTCNRCQDEAVAFGTGEASIKRALAELRENCSRNEENFYVAEEADGESKMPDPVVRPWWEKKR